MLAGAVAKPAVGMPDRKLRELLKQQD